MKNIYLCGPTVYNTPHIGNMRPILTFDMYIRALNFLGTDTNLIHNITDVDDKIIDKAYKENTTEQVIAERYTAEYTELLLNYNIQTPDSMPKVTENIDPIIKYVQKMVDNGSAYELDGDVYFSVENSEGYGSVSNRNLEEMRFEESNKRHPGDFALWKKTNVGVKFDSPWGEGRPGWHTECAVFVDDNLKGESLDVHGGGVDLIFPHHENEQAQYKAVSGNDITKEWKHVGHLSLDGEKMSKSLGNVISAFDFIEQYEADTLRMLFFTTSPTGPINLTDELINQLKDQTSKWQTAFAKAQLEESTDVDIKAIAELISTWNFAEANKLINEEIKTFNKTKENASSIIEIMKMVGFNFSKVVITKEIKDKFSEWKELRAAGKYDEADIIRDELTEYALI